MRDPWLQWQGHVVNDAYPLRQLLGCSDHSGVFLTDFPAQHPSAVAIKIVAIDPQQADALLSRWRVAVGLTDPHLIRLLEVRRCQLAQQPCLYAIMEYADQTLAQLLLHRSLTEDEAWEMLGPILDALSFLHGRGLIEDQLKPANVLVVGEQLKLASDTVCSVDEQRPAGGSPADDVRALGVTLFEALTRAPPAVLAANGGSVALPAEFSPALGELVARCLRPAPSERPDVSELQRWTRGRTVTAPEAVRSAAASAALPEPNGSEPQTPSPPPRVALEPEPASRRGVLTVTLAVLALVIIGWMGMRFVRHSRAPTPPVAVRSADPDTAIQAAPAPPAPVVAVPSASLAPSEAATAAAQPHEEIPAVPLSARQTIRGHLQVWVQVTVDKDGAVSAARADRPGPSKYFERLAIEAAKKWTFPPLDAPTPRLLQVRFQFDRTGTTAHAVPLE